MPSARARCAASMSQIASPITSAFWMSQSSRVAAVTNRSGSGLAWRTWSRVTTGTLAGSTPSAARLCVAVSIRPLVAIAHGMPLSLRKPSSSRAPGSGRTAPLAAWRAYAAACPRLRRCSRSGVIAMPVSRSSMFVNRPPLMPMRRWMRHTDSCTPSSSSDSFHASTCW